MSRLPWDCLALSSWEAGSDPEAAATPRDLQPVLPHMG